MTSLNLFTKGLLMSACISVSSQIFAGESQLIMKDCLAKVLIQPRVLAKDKGYQLISVPFEKIETIRKLAHHLRQCGGFYNVTHKVKKTFKGADYASLLTHYQPTIKRAKSDVYQVTHQTTVNGLIANIEPNRIWDTLSHLSAYNDRSATTDTGVAAAHWIKSTFDTLASEAGRDDVESYYVNTGWQYKQPSVVTVMGKDLPGEAVVMGAHIDTLSYNMPGADDDGSGSSSLLEAVRVLLNAKKLTHPVYFLWYAAEERGLVGSSYVVDDFLTKGKKVKAVLQFDMTGYRYHAEKKIWLLKDNVDLALTAFIGKLVTTYTDADIGYTKCGYACSDHASWTNEGFRAACPFEAKFGNYNPYIHSSKDTMEHVSLAHMVNFTKLAIAFATELAA